ncbi:unnamed protein product [Macrosiphum euphorbiae]|uniref:Uncharacterized protein n=1 Tax=Macrosiphum euphorbiae TaxID=13131 RepID=A0AAV0WWD6_9HEMI|nr:unnamed protein product [Macrosiphum euphorbiae]
MATPKSKGGSCCAVASCKNYSGKANNTGRTDMTFHRFPKDDLLLKEDDYVRDLKSELSGYAPRVKFLKTNVTPSLNLPDGHDKCVSESGIQLQKRKETKLFRQVHDEIITLALNGNVPSSSTQHSEFDLEPTQSLGLSQSQDYEHLYNKLLLEHEQLLTITKSGVDYKKINQNLLFQVRDLEKNLKVTNLLLKNTEKKKQRVHWSIDEISKAFSLRYFSKRAYVMSMMY